MSESQTLPGPIGKALHSGRVRVTRRLHDLAPREQLRARRDHDAVVGAVPELAGISEVMAPHARRLAPAHEDYCSRVGHPVHAASIELTALMLALVERRQVRRVVDLGSGFTSWALRQYKRDTGADLDIWSVDDSPEWLAKTRAFLAETGLDDDQLRVWSEFIEEDGHAGTFDLVLHDLGFMDTRFKALDKASALARPGGLVVLDDMHKPDFRDKALAQLEARGQAAYSLKVLTRDSLTRYAYLLPIPL